MFVVAGFFPTPGPDGAFWRCGGRPLTAEERAEISPDDVLHVVAYVVACCVCLFDVLF